MLNTSAKELALVEKGPLYWFAGSSPAGAAADVGVGPTLGLTRSAHSLGGALTGGGVDHSAELMLAFPCSGFVGIVASAALSRVSPFDGIAGFSASEVTLASVFLLPRDGRGMLGIAGLIGRGGMIG